MTCSDARAKATIEDDRMCDIPDYGPDPEAKAERLADFKTCIESNWYTETYYYFTNEVVLDGNYDTAIVQAVRLNQKRRYPVSTTSYVDLSDSATGFPSKTNAWQCRDGTSCADSDPYQVLDANTITAKQTMAGIVAATKDYDSAVSSGYDAVKTATTTDRHAFATLPPVSTTAANGNDGVAADHIGVATWQCSKAQTDGTLSGCGNQGYDGASDEQRTAAGQGPSYEVTVDLKNPPMGYPEAYLFAAVSFDFVHGAHAGAGGTGGINTGNQANTDYSVDDSAATTITGATTQKTDSFHTKEDKQADHGDATTSGATGSRRLGAKRNLKSTVRTLMVNAVQNVIQK